MPHSNDTPILVSQRDYLLPLPDVRSQRFLNQHCDAVFYEDLRQLKMRHRRSGYRDRIDLAQQLRAVCIRLAPVTLGKAPGPFRIYIHNSDKLTLRQLAVNLGMYSSHLARTNNRRSYSGILHSKTLIPFLQHPKATARSGRIPG